MGIIWDRFIARRRADQALSACGLEFSDTKYRSNGSSPYAEIEAYKSNGIILSQYNNTWNRKRETGYLIQIEYIWNGKKIFKHVEPWVNFPSDELVAKLTLLPREVKPQ